MKMLIINANDGVGGAAIACKRLHTALLARGHDSKLLVIQTDGHVRETYGFVGHEPFLARQIRKIKQRLLNYRFLRPYKSNPEGHYLHTPTPSVFDITQHELFAWADVINLHWVSGFLDFPSFFSKENKKKVIWTLHDMNAFTGGCHHAETCEGFKFECRNCPQLSAKYPNYNHQNWTRKSQSNLANLSIIAPSKWMNDASLASSLFRNQPHFIIPNAIDTTVFKVYDKHFAKSFFNAPPSQKIVLFAVQNASTPLKGMHYILNILDKFSKNISFLVVGNYDIKAIHKNIIPIGTIHDERLMALVYNAADVLVLPSLAENLPNVIVESLSCGTPVVAFDVGGIPELIHHGKNGYLVEKGNAQSLFEHINEALNTDWDTINISKKSHALFNLDKQAAAYCAVFENAL
jgi:glycosyltransferase involved in cell wall biosynthesis